MKINGKETEISYENMEELLISNGYNIKHVAVECNGEILAKSTYASYVPKSEDVIEVVTFVGGG